MAVKPLNDYQCGEVFYHVEYGKGTIRAIHQEENNIQWKIDFAEGDTRTLDITLDQLTEPPPAPGEARVQVTLNDIKKVVKDALADQLDMDDLPLGDRWIGGTLNMIPGTEGMKEKVIPIELFFHKIVMLRDRLRVLEQRLNAHSKLSDEEKIQMQQYITRIYGTLTTFNVLFREKSDWFVGERGSG